MTTILGIDEAGRGPVIGPMVIAGVSVSQSGLELLEELNLKDSKKMSPSSRESSLKDLQDANIKIVENVVPARRINNKSLTTITLTEVSNLINELNPDRVLLDAPGHPDSINRFIRQVRKKLRTDSSPDIRAEPGADDQYPIVSAASIAAKVKRDRIIEELSEEYGNVGSGYPSDPNTRQYLRNLLESGRPIHSFVRTRWKTFQNLLEEQGGPLFYESSTNDRPPNDR